MGGTWLVWLWAVRSETLPKADALAGLLTLTGIGATMRAGSRRAVATMGPTARTGDTSGISSTHHFRYCGFRWPTRLMTPSVAARCPC